MVACSEKSFATGDALMNKDHVEVRRDWCIPNSQDLRADWPIGIGSEQIP
jgi:hypothetical protein